MAFFPALQPAFKFKVDAGTTLEIGSASRGSPLKFTPMIGGRVESVPGFHPVLNGEVISVGNNYIQTDADNRHCRPDARVVIRTDDGAIIQIRYKGILKLGPEEIAAFRRNGAEGYTPVGNIFTDFAFQTGDDRYKELENMVFVSHGRLFVQSESMSAEYHVSRVVIA